MDVSFQFLCNKSIIETILNKIDLRPPKNKRLDLSKNLTALFQASEYWQQINWNLK